MFLWTNQMLPIFTSQNSPNSTWMYSVKIRNFHVRQSSKCSRFFLFSNFIYLFYGQLMWAASICTIWKSSLKNHIHYIIGLRSKPKMRGIYASWIITAMQHIHAFFNRPIMHYPTQTMNKALFLVGLPNYSIPFVGQSTDPRPASWSFFHFVPKSSQASLTESLRFYKFWSKCLLVERFCEKFDLHDQVLFDCVALRGEPTPPGQFHFRNLKGIVNGWI